MVFPQQHLNTTVAIRAVGSGTMRTLGMARAPKCSDRAATRVVSEAMTQ